MVTVKEALAKGSQLLAQQQSSDTRLDTQVLLGHVIGAERAQLLAYPERDISNEQFERYWQLIARRARGEPVAYLTGHKEFFGLDFCVDRRVLIPRPETELLVEAALGVIGDRIAAGSLPVVADIGTGSAAIAITIAVKEPRLPYLYACDISAEALEVARLNCLRHHVETRVRLLQGDLLAPLPEPIDVLVANLPYVGTDEMASIAPDVLDYEPHAALFSGPYGLSHLRRLFVEAAQSDMLKRGGGLLLEIGYQQCEPLTNLLHELWPQAQVICQQDYAGWDRLIQVLLL
jgi:release factor glutamine methyltransferase